MTKINSIREYLTFLDKIHQKQIPAGWKITPAGLLLAHGKPFTSTAETFKGRRGKQGRCFMNAGRMAINGEGIYCEGYFTSFGIPIDHAWIVSYDGKTIIDPTIRNLSKSKRDLHMEEYFGIPFKTDYLLKRTNETHYWGLLGQETMDKRLYNGEETDFVHTFG
jgi:hypothetical protein